MREGKSVKWAVCDEEVTLEGKVWGILSGICDKVGDIWMRELGGITLPLIMADSGLKYGSKYL